MTKRISLYGVLAVAVLLQACRPENTFQSSHQYFDLNGLLSSQEKQLAGYFIEKNSLLDGRSDAQKLQADWTKEFDLVREADINKPSWQGSFLVDSTTNQTCYSAQNQDITVKKLCVTYSSKHLPVHIWAQISEDNMLYTSGREMHLYFDTTRNAAVLQAYTLKGFQKVILMDSLRYQVQTHVLVKKP